MNRSLSLVILSEAKPATMLAYGAEVVATGPKGARTIPINKFFTGVFATALPYVDRLLPAHTLETLERSLPLLVA